MRKFTKSDSVVERKVRNSRILVPLNNSNARIDSIYTLNPTGAFVWDMVLLGLSDDEIVARLTDEYNVGEDSARQDTERLLNELMAAGALKTVEAGDQPHVRG